MRAATVDVRPVPLGRAVGSYGASVTLTPIPGGVRVTTPSGAAGAGRTPLVPQRELWNRAGFVIVRLRGTLATVRANMNGVAWTHAPAVPLTTEWETYRLPLATGEDGVYQYRVGVLAQPFTEGDWLDVETDSMAVVLT